MALSSEQQAFYKANGYIVARGLLPPADVEQLRRRFDDIAYGRITLPQGEKVGNRATGVSRRPGAVLAAMGHGASVDPAESEVMLTDHHARRGRQVYPTWRRPITEEERRAALTTADPWNEIVGINHLCDHDEFFHPLAGHPNIVAVLNDLIGPDVKLFFDHLFVKVPFAGPNRYHQDGFFMFSEAAATCWIALDDVTVANGCFHYIPTSVGYGKFDFDHLAGGVTERELAHDVEIELAPGDALFHDRWTLHATGPNHTPRWRRGWALHYTSARSRLVTDPTWLGGKKYKQTPDGLHWQEDLVYGNMRYLLVSGQEYPGCI